MPHEIFERLKGKASVKITSAELERLLTAAELLSETDTFINKTIRLLRVDGRLVVQEFSFSGDVFAREVESAEAAEVFIQSRLATYERMWDGCGCKIDFEQ